MNYTIAALVCREVMHLLLIYRCYPNRDSIPIELTKPGTIVSDKQIDLSSYPEAFNLITMLDFRY